MTYVIICLTPVIICLTSVIICLTSVIICLTSVIFCLTYVIICLTPVIFCLTSVIICWTSVIICLPGRPDFCDGFGFSLFWLPWLLMLFLVSRRVELSRNRTLKATQATPKKIIKNWKTRVCWSIAFSIAALLF